MLSCHLFLRLPEMFLVSQQCVNNTNSFFYKERGPAFFHFTLPVFMGLRPVRRTTVLKYSTAISMSFTSDTILCKGIENSFLIPKESQIWLKICLLPFSRKWCMLFHHLQINQNIILSYKRSTYFLIAPILISLTLSPPYLESSKYSKAWRKSSILGFLSCKDEWGDSCTVEITPLRTCSASQRLADTQSRTCCSRRLGVWLKPSPLPETFPLPTAQSTIY